MPTLLVNVRTQERIDARLVPAAAALEPAKNV
jgi:hypothetical protein